MNDGELLSRSEVHLNPAMAAVVEKMHSRDTIDQVRVQKITYVSDGLRVMGYVAGPRQAGLYPVLLWNRGGTGDRGALDELRAFLILAATAQWGYVVLATQYRGNMGGEGREEWGCADVNDTLNLLPVAQQIPDCNNGRVGIEGASRGGMSVYCALKKDDRFRCATVHAGITDLFELSDSSEHFAEVVQQRWGDLTIDEQRRELAERSAVYFADQLPRHTPILLMHGTADKVVPMSQSEAMARQLSRLGLEHELIKLEGGGHHAHKDGSYSEMDRHRRRWLDKWLG
ncbi:MAG: prolyl oligopeptidase family serine peptidase [bacterium]